MRLGQQTRDLRGLEPLLIDVAADERIGDDPPFGGHRPQLFPGERPVLLPLDAAIPVVFHKRPPATTSYRQSPAASQFTRSPPRTPDLPSAVASNSGIGSR